MTYILSDAMRHGYGCFETICIIDQKPQYLTEHISRLKRSCQALDIDFAEDNTIYQIEHYISQHISTPDIYALRLVQYHNMPLYIEHSAYNRPSCDISLWHSPQHIVHTSLSLLHHKTCNYLFYRLAKKYASDIGHYDSIIQNEKNHIVETSTANIYFSEDGQNWLTPHVDDGCLGGIIRQRLLANAPVTESHIHMSQIYTFKYCCISSSMIGIMPVVSIQNMPYDISLSLASFI